MQHTYPLTDCGNAERFVDQHADCIRYCDAMGGWVVWDGRRWSSDRAAAVQLAKKTVRTMRLEHSEILRRSGCQSETSRPCDDRLMHLRNGRGARRVLCRLLPCCEWLHPTRVYQLVPVTLTGIRGC